MTASLDLIRGRQTVLFLTNKSGGALAAGDVVIVDTGNDSAVTTTTTAGSTKPVGVVQEAIASNAQGRVCVQGYVALVNVPSSQTRGQYLATHTVAKQAAGAAARVAGSFAYLETGGTTPAAQLFGVPDLGTGSGLADQGTFTYLDASEAAAPGTPASGKARIYAKTDGRFYSKDDAGVEFGPFDAAGGGGLYVYDQLFPGSSLPAGWTFTGSGSCVVTGGVAQITGAAQSDRLMYAFSPAGQYLVKAHLKNVTGGGGMPSLCVLNAAGTGYGIGPYNDGSLYDWAVTTYAYNATGSGIAFSSEADYWVELFIAGGKLMGSAHSTDGTTWQSHEHLGTAYTMTQLGIVQLFTSANIYAELDELQICEP